MKNMLKQITAPNEQYMNRPKVDFEKLTVTGGPSELSRAKVFGGWLVWSLQQGVSNGGGTCFIPDPNHEWTPKTPNQIADEEKLTGE